MKNENMSWDMIIDQLTKKAHQNPEFKKNLLSNPKEKIEEELGLKLSENVKVKIHENTTDIINVILPMDLSTLEISEEFLEKISGGGSGTGGSLLSNAKDFAKTVAGKNEEKAFQAQVKEWQKTLSPSDVATLVSANFSVKK